MPLPAAGAAGLWCTHAPALPTRGAAQRSPGIRLPKDFSRLPSVVFCRGPQRQKFHCWKLEGEGESVRKTHPSGRGKENFPRLEGGPQISPKLSPHAAFASPTAPHHDPGTYTRRGRGYREAGQRGFPKYREGAARAEIPAWRKRGPAPAQGRRRRRAPSVHRPRRR